MPNGLISSASVDNSRDCLRMITSMHKTPLVFRWSFVIARMTWFALLGREIIRAGKTM